MAYRDGQRFRDLKIYIMYIEMFRIKVRKRMVIEKDLKRNEGDLELHGPTMSQF